MNRFVVALIATITLTLAAGCGGSSVTAPEGDAAFREGARVTYTKQNILNRFPVHVKFETGEQALLGEVYLDVQRVLRGAHSTVLTLVLPTVNTRISVLGTRISSQPISYSGFTTVVSTIDAPGSEVTDTLLVTLNNEGRAGYSVTGTITRKIVVWTIDENGNQVFTRERLIRGLITSR